jgi:3-hydroxyisobutyrate dehydrogenase
MGATVMEPLDMAKKCDAIFLMLGYPKDVEQLTIGSDGILKHMKHDSYLIDHTTSSPDLAEKIYNQAIRSSIFSYDAPVSGGDIGAKEGKLVCMVGGLKDQFRPIEKIMQSYSSKIKLMGGSGKGQHTKMSNQIIIASTMIGLLEGIVYGYKAGLNLHNLIELLSSGAAGSFSMMSYGPRIIKRDFDPGFYVEHFVKDLEIALLECKKLNLKLEGMELALKFYKMMVDEGYGKKGTQGLLLVLEKLNELKVEVFSNKH